MIERMELTIVGAGAIGGIIGAHLWRAGHAVQLVDRDHAHVAAIQAGGLEVAGHAELVARVPACEPEAVTGPIETLILAVKTLHTEEALRPLVSRLAPDGWVISMQNGLEEGKIAALVGESRTAAAFLSFGGYYDRPGRVVYSGPGTLKVGELDGRLTSRITALARVLSDFHPTDATANIRGHKWGKLLLGTVYFATAMVDEDVVDLLEDASIRRTLSGLVAEGLAVADALGVAVQPVDGFDPRSLRGGESESAGGARDVGRASGVLAPHCHDPRRGSGAISRSGSAAPRRARSSARSSPRPSARVVPSPACGRCSVSTRPSRPAPGRATGRTSTRWPARRAPSPARARGGRPPSPCGSARSARPRSRRAPPR